MIPYFIDNQIHITLEQGDKHRELKQKKSNRNNLKSVFLHFSKLTAETIFHKSIVNNLPI